MNVTISRPPANKVGEEIVNVLLVTTGAGTQRGKSEINHNESSRKIINASGPKNSLMFPTKLIEIVKRTSKYRGVLTMYSRSYNRDGNEYTINSAVTVEAKIPDTRPEEL